LPPPPVDVREAAGPPAEPPAVVARSVYEALLADLAEARRALATAAEHAADARTDGAALDEVAEALGLDPTTATAESILGRARLLSEDPVGAVAIRQRVDWYTAEAARLNALADHADKIAALDAEAEALAAEASRIAARQAEVAERRAALVAA
jgi:hypothetical protein